MTSFARTERETLADVLAEAGPDAPTLCAGWTAQDLAAHIVVRDRRPDAGPGIVVPLLSGWTDRVTRGIAERSEFTDLVRQVRAGAPFWSPMGLPVFDKAVNLIEMFVHVEDVRRAAEGWEPRALDPAMEDALWARLTAGGRMLFRKARTGVVLRREDGTTTTAKAGDPSVMLSGRPSELMLYAYGRKDHAQIEFEGTPEAVAIFQGTSLGV
jgi:uncharacterized protein (TIGR03085 family)